MARGSELGGDRTGGRLWKGVMGLREDTPHSPHLGSCRVLRGDWGSVRPWRDCPERKAEGYGDMS